MQSTLKIIAKVEDLNRYDMIYIYHHINIGNDVTLIKVDSNPDKYKVYFKEFCLGYIVVPKWFEDMKSGVKQFKAKVNSISKTKFLPTKGMDLELSA